MVYVMFIFLIVAFGFSILQGALAIFFAIFFAILEPLIYGIGVILVCVWDIFTDCVPKWLRITIIAIIVIAIGIFIKNKIF